jgi:hypothetical protein
MGGLGSDANIWQRLTRLEVDLAASSCWLVDLIHFHSSQVNNLCMVASKSIWKTSHTPQQRSVICLKKSICIHNALPKKYSYS